MNVHQRKLTEALADPTSAELLKTRAAEEKSRTAQLGEPVTPVAATESDQAYLGERESYGENKGAIDRCLKAAEIMTMLFPEGVELRNPKDFATHRLFDALVGTVAHFAQTGMVQASALSAISRYATLLEDLIRTDRQP